MLGSDKDPTWRDFPQALAETRGVRRYVTLFEAPFKASVLSDHENNTLWVSSLLAMPPSAPGTQPLAGLMTVDLPGSSLTQWAMHIQDVTSGMIMPPEAVTNCPQEDIVGVLNWLERMTLVKYCHLCFGVGKKCGCSSAPRQTPSQASALWMPPTMSYAAMASSTETMASSSVGGVPTPGRQEASQVTPYRQQVYLPRHTTGVQMTTTMPSTTPSTDQGHNEEARGTKGARGRSSSRGPQGWNRRDRSSTRGSRKCQ